MLLPRNWRLLRTDAADGAQNMAVDLTLMDVARSRGAGIMRVYSWTRPTVSFGRNERVAGVYLAEDLAEAGLDAVRRPTGGRALLHAREVTYSVAIPIADDLRWNRAYQAINGVLLAAMQNLGVPAHIAGNHAPTAPDHATASRTPSHDLGVVCFSGIAPGEIAVGKRKLVASSVWRERGAYLQHGSILIHDDQSRLIDLMGTRVAPAEPAAELSAWMPSASSQDATIDAVEIALKNALDDCGKTMPWSIPKEVQEQANVTRSALDNPAWLWRR